MKGTKAFMSGRWTEPAVAGSPWYCWQEDREAFLEASEPPNGYDDYDDMDAILATAAEQEARRILAETEPERDQNGDRTAHVPADFPEWGMDAARESVSAFLTAPDPAAYLAKMQEGE